MRQSPELELFLQLAACGLIWALILAAIALLFVAGAGWMRRRFDSWMTPDPQALQQQLDRLRTRFPAHTEQALVERVITLQAIKAGVVGAVTGLGGMITLPLAIPVDFALTAKLQASLIHFMGQLYAPQAALETRRTETYAIMAGSRITQQLAEASSRVAQAAIARLIRRLMAEALAESMLKIVPLIGGVVGFVFNYATTRALGQFAARSYRREQRALPASVGLEHRPSPVKLEVGEQSSHLDAV